MVQTFPAYRADDAFCVRILPGSPWCNQYLVDSHVPDSAAEVFAIDVIAVSQQEPGGLFHRKRFDNLLSGPPGHGIGCDVEVDYAPALMPEHQEDVQDSEGDGRDGEEVDGRDLSGMILQEGAPSLGRRLGMSCDVSGHRGFGQVVAQQE
jgi:hypothetical protein